jgi:hypothetical protein
MVPVLVLVLVHSVPHPFLQRLRLPPLVALWCMAGSGAQHSQVHRVRGLQVLDLRLAQGLLMGLGLVYQAQPPPSLPLALALALAPALHQRMLEPLCQRMAQLLLQPLSQASHPPSAPSLT